MEKIFKNKHSEIFEKTIIDVIEKIDSAAKKGDKFITYKVNHLPIKVQDKIIKRLRKSNYIVEAFEPRPYLFLFKKWVRLDYITIKFGAHE